ncbi:hypothetical protein KQI69_04680, partial [Eubacterium sp. MSJ-13]|uniref:hypothetical protein n=1 Tax=Eubacterium sp. MSJ-13 TaxID=2841513 RepID=UPI001C10A55A
SQADIRNPLCYLLITLLAAVAAYQKGVEPLLIQASPYPHLLLYAIEVGDFLDSVKIWKNWRQSEDE